LILLLFARGAKAARQSRGALLSLSLSLSKIFGGRERGALSPILHCSSGKKEAMTIMGLGGKKISFIEDERLLFLHEVVGKKMDKKSMARYFCPTPLIAPCLVVFDL